jgi:hypothetical protein
MSVLTEAEWKKLKILENFLDFIEERIASVITTSEDPKNIEQKVVKELKKIALLHPEKKVQERIACARVEIDLTGGLSVFIFFEQQTLAAALEEVWPTRDLYQIEEIGDGVFTGIIRNQQVGESDD